MTLTILAPKPRNIPGDTNNLLMNEISSQKPKICKISMSKKIHPLNHIIPFVLILTLCITPSFSFFGKSNLNYKYTSNKSQTTDNTKMVSCHSNTFSITPRCTTSCTTILMEDCYDNSTNFYNIFPESGTSVTISCLISRGCLLQNSQAINTPQYLKLNCALIVDQDYTFYNSQIFVKGTTNEDENFIEVGGHTLHLIGTTLRGCNESWTGIRMASGGSLILRSSTLDCNIYDARYGIKLASNSYVSAYKTTFRRCSIGIYGIDVSSFNHLFIANNFYGDEILNTPLKGYPLNGISLTNCSPIRMVGLQCFDYGLIAIINIFFPFIQYQYPVYLNKTSFSVSSFKCDGHWNDCITAIDVDSKSNLNIYGAEINNFSEGGNQDHNWDGIFGGGFYTEGYNLYANSINIDNTHLWGVNFLPKVYNIININHGTIEGRGLHQLSQSIRLNPNRNIADFYGTVSDMTIFNSTVGIVTWGRKGLGVLDDPNLKIEHNNITDCETGIATYNSNYIGIDSNIINTTDYTFAGIQNQDCDLLYVKENNLNEDLVFGIWHINTTNSLYKCNTMTANTRGLVIEGDAPGNFFEKNTWYENNSNIHIQGGNIPLQDSKFNRWFPDNNCGILFKMKFKIGPGDVDTEYDPGNNCRSTDGTNHPSTLNCDGNFEKEMFLTPFVNDVVTGNISYPDSHLGEAYQNRWYAYELFYQFPDLLNNYDSAQIFYNAIDTTMLAGLYHIYFVLSNLQNEVENEKDSLRTLFAMINSQEYLLMASQDSIDFEMESSKNDSLIQVVDSLSSIILGMIMPHF